MKKLLILLFSLSSTLHAEVTLHRLFGSGMVLQRETEVAIWGWAEPGEQVSLTCSWNNTPISIKADVKGDWSAKLKTEKAGGPHTIDVAGSNKITLNDVLFGEVWLASGQSNMEMPLHPVGGPYRGIHNWEEEIANANYPNLRFFQIGSIKAKDKQKRIKAGVKKKFIRQVPESKWQSCSPETVKYFSAVAYFFARDLNEELDVPIGIIDASWGATYIQQWISAEYLKQVGPDAGKSSKKTPTLIYNGMIAPLMPFTLRGAIWNQGEGNSGAPENYKRLMEALVADWRSGFQRDLSFYYVQLAPFNYNARTNVALLREQQFKALSIEKSAMAVTLDIGNLKDIHPKNKQEVGRRLALCALANDYNKKIVFSGPLYRGMEIKGSKIHLKFDHVGSGLDVFGGGELNFFEIAGKDGVLIKGNAVILGDEVLVDAATIKNPVAVRYAFKNQSTASLINKEGLPASSFRTDD